MEIGDIYIYIYIYGTCKTLYSADSVIRNVGGVKCQPHLKRSNYW